MPLENPEMVILAADVGGTNLNLALATMREGRFGILRKASFPTKVEESLQGPVLRFLENCAQRGISEKPDIACISGAGPVHDKYIPLTNAPWDIDGRALERKLGIPVHVVNDFTAVCHGILLLDLKDESQLLTIPHLDASVPTVDPHGTAVIVGAGTGLGVGYVVRIGDTPHVFPSEGGHIGLPLLDEETIELWKYLRASCPAAPGAESAVSGPGIGNIFSFLVDSGRIAKTSIIHSILDLPVEERPAAIAQQASLEPTCARAMGTFVDLYARVCADLCAVFMPRGGLFLSGGIAPKNEQHFLAGERFMKSFERNYRDHINAITRSTPVFIVRDYSISLYGAAHAGYCQARIG
ncbi:MAG: glucokinase [Holophagaceae bacterium]|nr:glucokinase [Holophagaceae bacterium]